MGKKGKNKNSGASNATSKVEKPAEEKVTAEVKEPTPVPPKVEEVKAPVVEIKPEAEPAKLPEPVLSSAPAVVEVAENSEANEGESSKSKKKKNKKNQSKKRIFTKLAFLYEFLHQQIRQLRQKLSSSINLHPK